MNRNLRLLAAVAVLVALVAVGAAGLLSGGAGSGSSRPSPSAYASNGTVSIDPASGLPWIPQSALPPEAQATLDLIDRGGPFPYSEDGEVFGNYEGILPDESHGYYHEYTVTTPGSEDRGARRIITGSHGEFYWTADHYESFNRIDRSS